MNVAPLSVSTSQGQALGSGVKVSRVILKVLWTLACTQGTGHCKGKVTVVGPDSGSTRLYSASPIISAGGGAGGVKKGAPLRSLIFTCAGPCGATTHGWFYVQTQFDLILAGKTINFKFDTDCGGQRQVQDIKLVYRANGSLNRKASTLGGGKTG